MFCKNSCIGYKEIIPGINLKTLVYGDKTLFTEFKMEKGSEVPKHSHPYEQTGYLISGKIQLSIEDEKFNVDPGDSWCIPMNIEHKAEITEDSVLIEVFSPVRDDYLHFMSI